MRSYSEFFRDHPLPYELEHELALRALARAQTAFVIQDPFLDGLLEETHQFLRNERATFPIDPPAPPTDENPRTIEKDSRLGPSHPIPPEQLDEDRGKDNQEDQAQQ